MKNEMMWYEINSYYNECVIEVPIWYCSFRETVVLADYRLPRQSPGMHLLIPALVSERQGKFCKQRLRIIKCKNFHFGTILANLTFD